MWLFTTLCCWWFIYRLQRILVLFKDVWQALSVLYGCSNQTACEVSQHLDFSSLSVQRFVETTARIVTTELPIQPQCLWDTRKQVGMWEQCHKTKSSEVGIYEQSHSRARRVRLTSRVTVYGAKTLFIVWISFFKKHTEETSVNIMLYCGNAFNIALRSALIFLTGSILDVTSNDASPWAQGWSISASSQVRCPTSSVFPDVISKQEVGKYSKQNKTESTSCIMRS